jgi:hypothetical protein
MMAKPKKQIWLITVGGGYGSFLYEGTEKQAEQRRKDKADWEGAVARKRLATDEEATPDRRSECARVRVRI